MPFCTHSRSFPVRRLVLPPSGRQAGGTGPWQRAGQKDDSAADGRKIHPLATPWRGAQRDSPTRLCPVLAQAWP